MTLLYASMPQMLLICNIYFTFTLHDICHNVKLTYMLQLCELQLMTYMPPCHIYCIYAAYILHSLYMTWNIYVKHTYMFHICTVTLMTYMPPCHICSIYVTYILHTHYMTYDIYVELTYMLLILYKYMIHIWHMCNIYCNICVIYL